MLRIPYGNVCIHSLPRLDNLHTMTGRVHQMRDNLFLALKTNGTPGNWEHIVKQIGMFSFTGLTG